MDIWHKCGKYYKHCFYNLMIFLCQLFLHNLIEKSPFVPKTLKCVNVIMTHYANIHVFKNNYAYFKKNKYTESLSYFVQYLKFWLKLLQRLVDI